MTRLIRNPPSSLPPMKEARFQNQILRAALLEGWVFTYHPWLSIKSTSGWPDLVLGHPDRHRLLIFEVKVENDRTSRERKLAQAAWIEFLDSIPGITARIVRPSDWDMIVELLRG